MSSRAAGRLRRCLPGIALRMPLVARIKLVGLAAKGLVSSTVAAEILEVGLIILAARDGARSQDDVGHRAARPRRLPRAE